MEEAALSGRVSDSYIEKSFLWLVALSFVLHVAGLVLWQLWPQEKPQKPPEAQYIDLQDMPEIKPQRPVPPPKVVRKSDRYRRVAKEMAPRVTPAQPKQAAPSRMPTRPSASPSQPVQTAHTPDSRPIEPPGGKSARELFKPRKSEPKSGGSGQPQPSLMPSASRMAKLEEQYRRRFADDIADGDTQVGLNTDDIKFGAFLSRLSRQVYLVWRYPQEAAMKGIEGVTPVRITFNRKGEIIRVQLIESSGSKILDDEVIRTLKLIGPLGSLPKDYTKDEFNLIAFFQYGNARARLR
jgi:protein TonB